MNILITICGREGSKGLKGKNSKKFLDIPLYYYTLASALLFYEQSSSDVDIVFSTDSKSILDDIRRLSWLHQVKRPDSLSRDFSAKLPVIIHATNVLEKRLEKNYEVVIDLDITSPLRTVQDIKKVYHKLINENDIDTVFSVVEARRNPFFNMVMEKNGEVKKVLDSDFVARQEAPKIYDMNASIYAYRRNQFNKKLKTMSFDSKCDISIMEDTGILDIDSEKDYELMQVIAKYLFNNRLSILHSKTNEIYQEKKMIKWKK